MEIGEKKCDESEELVLELDMARILFAEEEEEEEEEARIVVSIKDITERKQAEEALRESQERFRTLYENSTVGLYRTTPDGRIYLANPALVRMLGYSSFDDLSTRNLEKNGFEPSYPRTQFVENIEKDGEVKGLESAWKRKDGTIIFVRESARAIRDSQAKTLYYDGTVEDITERKQAEEKLRESDQQYQTIGETIPYGVWLTDAIGYCTYVSKSFLELVDMTMEQVQEFGWLHLLPPEDVEPTKEHWLHCVQTGECFEREHRFRTQDGSYRNILAIGRPIKDDTGKIVKWVGLNLDITERKRAEEEIRKKNAELKAFVDMLSHDLKNPVVSIQGFCSLLMKNHIKGLNEKALFYIQRMQANAGLMTDLLGDLVELSRIGRIEDKKTKISIQKVIKSAWAGASTFLATQNVEFVSPENLPQLFYSEKRLYQIFYNLLSNALKFRDEERKTKVEIGHQEDKDNYVFFVRDNGIGIEQKYHNKIFESFSQLKENKSEGTGMGLAIVKKIVEANQGKVWVESRKGTGSTFYFTIPKNAKS
jgi:PAS domain S-box-containing protein